MVQGQRLDRAVHGVCLSIDLDVDAGHVACLAHGGDD
jgi:hypothetical protein